MKQNQFLKTYLKFLQKFLKPQKPLRVVFDCSNGVAGLVLKKIDRPLYSKFYILNSIADGNFPAHGPNPLKPGAVKQLQAAVKKNKADLGIIFDADADRVFFVDDKERLIGPDVIARLLIWHLKPKKIVIDATTGWLVKKGIMNNELGIKNKTPIIHNSKFRIHESKVGHFFIKKLMRQKRADFGSEHSGHYYFKQFFCLDSGILAAIEVINAVSKLPYNFSDFVDFSPKYYHSEINFKLSASSAKSQEFFKKIENHYLNLAPKPYNLKPKVSHLDGLTMEFSDWWFNLRFSQTESLIRLNIEALEKPKFQEETFKFKKILKLS